MSRRAVSIFLTLAVLCALATPVLPTRALAAPALPTPALPENKHELSQQAQDLRRAGNLVPFLPPQTVLAALFTADETSPKSIYGPVSAYEKTRDCATTWLIEAGELARIQALAAKKGHPRYEYTLTLEADCPGKVSHTVFVASPGTSPSAWLNWRSQFGRKSKERTATLVSLRKAVAAGLVLMAEMRSVSVNGQPVAGNLEDYLRAEDRINPVFDVQTGTLIGN